MTKRLLAFARQQPLAPRSIDVDTVVGGMQGLLRRTLSADIAIDVKRSKGLWRAFADQPQLESAILNLAINARDAMPDGGTLTIESANATLDETYAASNEDVVPGPYVMVAVSDTGTGMPPHVLARVFEPFFTTKGFGAGSGLGLSMIYGYIKQTKGHVRIYSEVGHGTTVRLYLPCADAGDHDARLHPTGAASVRRGDETILVAEDDAMVRSFVEAQLRGLGYTVTSVADGAAALEVLQGPTKVDLLFTDVVMPGGINGKQLADAAVLVRPGLRVLFTSGYTENALASQAGLHSGVTLLGKPYSRAALATAVRGALDQSADD